MFWRSIHGIKMKIMVGCYVDIFTLDCIDYDDFLQIPENRCYSKSHVIF